MCTQGFLFGICKASSDFLIREPKSLPQQAISELEFQCDVETGAIFEQTVALTYEGSCLKVRPSFYSKAFRASSAVTLTGLVFLCESSKQRLFGNSIAKYTE
jgi:hypothetical protein